MGPMPSAHERLRRYAFATALPVVLLLALLVSNEKQPFPADLRARDYAYERRTRPLTVAATVLHYAGNHYSVAAALLLAAFYLWRIGDKRAAVGTLILLACLGLFLISLKIGVGRERPDAARRAIPESGGSFPSGHAAGAAVVALVGIALTRGRARVAVGTGLVVFATAVAVSRVYAGVHYLSDIVAGFLLGASLFCACWSWVARKPA